MGGANDVICVIRHFECQNLSMGKAACCTVGCSNRFSKRSEIHFYRFSILSRCRA